VRHVIPALMVLALVTACDNQEAARRADESARIALTLMAHNDLRLDFVPSGDGEQDKMALADYRHKQRMKKGGLIESLTAVSRMGTRGEQYAVGTMLADAHSSTAHFFAGVAMRRWADQADRSTLLVTHLSKIDQVNGSIQLFDRSESDLQAKLRGERTTLSSQLGQYRSEVDDIGARIETAKKSLESHDLERKMKEAEATEHLSQIKDASGTLLLDLSQKAAEARLAAVRAEYRLKHQKINIDILNSELRVSSRKLEFSQQLQDAINSQVDQVARRQQSMADAHAEKQIERQELCRQLKELFSELMAAYNQNVEKPLISAVEHASTAVDIAEGVEQKAPRDSRRHAALNVVAMKVAKGHIQTQQIITKASFGHTLTVVADSVERLLERADEADRAQYATDIYRNQANEFTQQHEKLIAEAKQFIEAGLAESQELADGSEGDVANSAATLNGLFAAYAKRIDDTLGSQTSMRSSPPPAVASKPAASPATLLPSLPYGRGLVGVTEIVGELPALPQQALAENVSVLVWIDGRKLTPTVLRNTARMLLADNAGVVQGPLDEFANQYGQFASAGGTSLLVSAQMPREADGPPPGPTVDGALFVSLKPAADEAAIADMIRVLTSSNPMSPELTTERDGDWLMMRPSESRPDPEETPERRATFERAFAAAGDAPIRFVVVPDESMRQQMAASATMAGPQLGGGDFEQDLEGIQWIAASIKLADEFGLYSTIEYLDESSAAAAAQALNDQFDKQLAGGEISGPMAMFAPMIRSALQVRQEGSSMQMSLSGPALRGLVAMAAPMVTQMMGGGASGAQPSDPGAPQMPDAEQEQEPAYTE